MTEPVIVEAVRTPIGKRNGALSGVHPAELLGAAQVELIKRTGFDPSEVEQIFGGCVTQAGEQSFNITRTAWLGQGLPYEVAATTIDCQCGSSQQANHLVAGLIASGAVGRRHRLRRRGHEPGRSGAQCRQRPGPAVPAGFPLEIPDQFTSAERIAEKYSRQPRRRRCLRARVATQGRTGLGRGALRTRGVRRRGAGHGTRWPHRRACRSSTGIRACVTRPKQDLPP